MQTDTTRWFRLSALALVFAACASPDGPTTPSPLSELGMTCEVTVASGAMTCDSPSLRASPGLALNVIAGGPQNRYVTLASTGTAYSAGTQAFTSSVTVRNRMAQPIGTPDGTTVDPDGTRVFFSGGPTVTSGTGTVSVVGDGTATFTASNQPYYQYSGVLTPGSTSSPKTWTFVVPNSVNAFNFRVMVSTKMPHEAGVLRWEVVSPPASAASTDLYAVTTAGGEVWASGSGGKILHYTDAGGWVEQLSGSTGSNGLPGPIYSLHIWSSAIDGLVGMAVGGDGQGIRLYYADGAWTRQTSGTSTLQSVVAVGQEPYQRFWACGFGGIVYHATVANNFGRWTPDFTGNDLHTCSGTDTSNVFAAGANGFLAHFNGSAWTSAGYTTNTTERLYASARCPSGSAMTDMWLSGATGVIRHATSPFTTFTAQASGTTQALYAMDATSCTNVYAVGANGTILHYNGVSWSAQASGTLSLLGGVAIRTSGSGSPDVWVVGQAGTILRGVR